MYMYKTKPKMKFIVQCQQHSSFVALLTAYHEQGLQRSRNIEGNQNLQRYIISVCQYITISIHFQLVRIIHNAIWYNLPCFRLHTPQSMTANTKSFYFSALETSDIHVWTPSSTKSWCCCDTHDQYHAALTTQCPLDARIKSNLILLSNSTQSPQVKSS